VSAGSPVSPYHRIEMDDDRFATELLTDAEC